jgi:hypothetical protein
MAQNPWITAAFGKTYKRELTLDIVLCDHNNTWLEFLDDLEKLLVRWRLGA